MDILGYTFDVSHPRSLGKSSELSLSLYSSMLGCDFVYVRNTGDYRLRKAKGFEGIDPMSVKDKPFTGMNAKTLSFSGYYVFNHRHFSYPAAYNQSTVQRKSCGSAMLGAGFSKQAIQFDYTKLPPNWLAPPKSPTSLMNSSSRLSTTIITISAAATPTTGCLPTTGCSVPPSCHQSAYAKPKATNCKAMKFS